MTHEESTGPTSRRSWVEGLSRRGFLAAVGVVAATATGAAPATAGSPTSARPDALGALRSAATAPGLRYYYPVPRGPRRRLTPDICVYGGTSAGVAAAVEAARAGASVLLLAFNQRLGGLSASGLGATDTGVSASIGGIAGEFYRRIGQRYEGQTVFRFEPHVAEEVFEEWVAEEAVDVLREQRLESVRVTGGRISALVTESGLVVRAGAYIDATYEGDLMAAAGATWTHGREANAVYGETINGIQFMNGHQFSTDVDPYVVPGDPTSGLLQGVTDEPPGATGDGDLSIQAYNFRLCLTQAEDRLPFPRPEGYDPARYELLLRTIATGVWTVFGLNIAMPGGKSDHNNSGPVATDHIGGSDDWPTADYPTRERIFQDHVTYQQGMLHFLATDERVPADIRAEVSSWGLPRNEFLPTGGWPHELYIREGRRLVSEYVVTEHDCRGSVLAEDPIGLASYTMDSHNCRRIVVDGYARNEGNVEIGVPGPYPVSYRAIRPRPGEVTNLLVPVALSSSHIAFGSVRMEPVFMLLAQAAAIAATIALDAGTSVQEVPYPQLRTRLLQRGAILEWPPPQPLALEVGELAPGVPTTATVTVQNVLGSVVENAEVALLLPAGLTVDDPSPRRVGTLQPGASATATWQLTAATADEPVAGLDVEITSTAAPTPVTARVYVVEPLQEPWLRTGTGEVHAGQRGDRIAVTGAGRDLWTDVDEYGAAYRADALTGDATVTVRLVEQQDTHADARAGIMVRTDLTAAGASPGYVVLCAKPREGFLLLWDADGNGFVESAARGATDGDRPTPAWLRLQRTGSTYTGAWSTDGQSWTAIGSTEAGTSGSVDVGLFVTPYQDAPGRAVFDGFTLT